MYPQRNIMNVYAKIYRLPVQINTERYATVTGTAMTSDHETGGYTLFAPNNEGVQRFFDEKLSSYFSTRADVPADIWRQFIAAQFADGMVYPGLYHRMENTDGDFINGSGLYGPRFSENIYTDIHPASNGFFYGGNSYVKSSMFETVYTEVRLNSAYGMLNQAFDFFFTTSLVPELRKSEINGYPDEDFSLLLIRDELFESEEEDPSAGFSWGYSVEGDSRSDNEQGYQFIHTWMRDVATERMPRLIRSHLFRRSRENSLNERIDFFKYGDPDYGGYGYALNEYGDMVRYRNGELQMLGNYERGEWVKVTKHKEFSNGTVYTIDKLLQYARCAQYTPGSEQITCWGRPMTEYVREAAEINPNISKSAEYIRMLLGATYSTYSDFTFPMDNISYYTLLLPNNAAIDAAVAAGMLPELATNLALDANGVPMFATAADEMLARTFFKYHVIQGQVFIDDGVENMLLLNTNETRKEFRAVTLHKIETTRSSVAVKKTGKRLSFANVTKILDEHVEAKVVPGAERSNLFAPKSVIHEIDNYLIPPSIL
jgi:uncharacterized surface protein with fasciclin (FAS1) repeats